MSRVIFPVTKNFVIFEEIISFFNVSIDYYAYKARTIYISVSDVIAEV